MVVAPAARASGALSTSAIDYGGHGEVMDALLSGKWLGLVFGMGLGFAGAFGGIVAFIIVLVVGAAGLFAGLLIDGDIDTGSLFSGRRRGDQ